MAKGDIPGTSSARLPAAPSKVPRMGNLGRAPGGDQIRDIHGHFQGGFAINWIGIGDLQRELTALPGEVQGSMRAGAEQLAEEITLYAQKWAPWEDQTGDARAGLEAHVLQNNREEVSIVLAHGVDYGVYLENDHGGVYAIILPTMEHFAEEAGARIFGAKRRVV